MEKLKKSKPTEPLKLKVKRDDIVQIMSGKDSGKRGKVLRALPKENKVVVEGLNIMVKHRRQRQSVKPGTFGQAVTIPGGRLELEAPLFASKVMVVCPSCNRPTRVGYAFREGDEKLSRRKYRVCKHPDCAKAIDR